MRWGLMWYHPRILDHLPESRGIHVRKCRVCGKKFELLGPIDPDDPYLDVCGECMMHGFITQGRE